MTSFKIAGLEVTVSWTPAFVCQRLLGRELVVCIRSMRRSGQLCLGQWIFSAGAGISGVVGSPQTNVKDAFWKGRSRNDGRSQILR